MQTVEVGNIYRREKKYGGVQYIMCLPDNRWRYFDYPECPYFVHVPTFKPEQTKYKFIHKKYVPQVGDICAGNKHKIYRLIIGTRFNEDVQQFEIETYLIDGNDDLIDKPCWWSYDEFIQKLEFVCNQEDINCFVPGAICSWHEGGEGEPIHYYLITNVEETTSDEEYKYSVTSLLHNIFISDEAIVTEKQITTGYFRFVQHMDDV